MAKTAEQPHIILLTGQPGVGKTTIITRLWEHYRMKGLRVAGILTQESRGATGRVGFKIKDITSEAEGWLARTDGGSGLRIGRYTVETADLERVGVNALESAIGNSSRLVLVDELGPMEMTSASFRKAVSALFESKKVTVATVKYGSRYEEVEQATRRGTTLTITVTRENRDDIPERVISLLDPWLKL